jgi:hypothetical protein
VAIAEELLRGGVVSHGDIRPTVAIEIVDSHTQSFTGMCDDSGSLETSPEHTSALV